MSSILKRPGWVNTYIIDERIKIGDYDKPVPGWGPGKEAKKFFTDKEGQEVPTGRYGTMRTVGKTVYREAELAFARYLASSLEIAENVIATKEVKQILRDYATLDRLQEKGYNSVEQWVQGWIEYAQDIFGMDLTNVSTQRERAMRNAVQDVAQEIEDEVEDESEIEDDTDDEIEADDVVQAHGNAQEGTPLTPELKERISANAIRPQNADLSDDGTEWTKISFLGQSGSSLTYVYLKDVPKNRENTSLLRSIRTVGDVISNYELSKYITTIELTKNGTTKSYTVDETTAVPQMAPAAPAEMRREARPIELDLGESAKLSTEKRSILTEQMRISRMQHMQRIEQRYL